MPMIMLDVYLVELVCKELRLTLFLFIAELVYEFKCAYSPSNDAFIAEWVILTFILLEFGYLEVASSD